METFLTVLLALAIYVVIPILVGLIICTLAILYDRRFYKKERDETAEEAEKMVEEPLAEKNNNTSKVG